MAAAINRISVGVSARHLHLSKDDVAKLFGEGYELTVFKDLTQTGEFACNEKVSIVTEGGRFDNVRVLGPVRPETQVEISKSDSRRLRISPPIRNSGDLAGSASVVLEGPNGSVTLKQGCIIATRHIHMSPEEAAVFGVKDGQLVLVKVDTEKGGILGHVYVKAKPSYVLELHIDTDDASAFLLESGDNVDVINPDDAPGESGKPSQVADK